jgi:hypothetical protein
MLEFMSVERVATPCEQLLEAENQGHPARSNGRANPPGSVRASIAEARGLAARISGGYDTFAIDPVSRRARE